MEYESEENKNPELFRKLTPLIDLLEKEWEIKSCKKSSKLLPRITDFKNNMILLSSLIWNDDWKSAFLKLHNYDICFRKLNSCFSRKRKEKKEAQRLYQEAMTNVYRYIHEKIEEDF